MIKCPKCGNTDEIMGMEDPYVYDGICEYTCQSCGCRWGRWSGIILKDGESEGRYGQGTPVKKEYKIKAKHKI